MRTLHEQNFSNTRKYTAQDNAERIEAEREEAVLLDGWGREADKEEAERKAREPMVVKGLMQKYRMSDAGAQATLRHIKRDTLEHARFATPEMQQGAEAAYKFYWGCK